MTYIITIGASPNYGQLQMNHPYGKSSVNTDFMYINPNEQSNHSMTSVAQTVGHTSNDPQTSYDHIQMTTERTSTTSNCSGRQLTDTLLP